jgi:hypothetical protein
VVRRVLLGVVLGVFSAACGVGGAPSRSLSASQALLQSSEWLEFEPTSVRHDLFLEVAQKSQAQAGLSGPVLFPMLQEGAFVGAPGLDPKADLLSVGDAGAGLLLAFDETDGFSAERREAFQGLSEREAAELVARSLLNHWGLHPAAPVTVVRVASAPYAAAWMDGELRLNPAFVTLAAAP